MKHAIYTMNSLFFLVFSLSASAQTETPRNPMQIASDLVKLNRANMNSTQDKMISFNPFEGAGCLLTISNREGSVSFEPAKAEFHAYGEEVVITDDLSHTIESLEMKTKADAAKATALFWELGEACRLN